LPEELSNSQGQLVWQATYKTWGNTQAEEWKLVEADGSKTHPLDAGDQPENEARQQNLRFQGQYLDRDTGLHYNTFRYYDPDIGRFISPDPIGLEGGLNLEIYSPNPISWIDPWGWSCTPNGRKGAFNEAKRDAGIPRSQQPDKIYDPISGQMKQTRKVPMIDRNGVPIRGDDGKVIMTREYQFTRADGSKIIIQDHGAGHKYPGGIGNQGPHYNVRPAENPRTGKLPGTKEHYPF
jgi:RHS repeat-associated protein